MDLVESTLIIRALRCSILCGRDNETNNFELRQQFFLVSLGDGMIVGLLTGKKKLTDLSLSWSLYSLFISP